MKDIKKIEFINTPPEVAEKEREADKIAQKEAEIQPVIKEQIEEVIAPPKPIEWWVKRVLFWGMAGYIFIISVTPIFRAIKYSMGSNDNIQFSKEKPELITAMREYRNARIGEVDQKILEAFKD